MVLERPQISWSALASPNHTENKQKTSYLFSPRDQENTILGEQAMCLCTFLLNTWMFILLEPSPFPLTLLKWMTAHGIGEAKLCSLRAKFTGVSKRCLDEWGVQWLCRALKGAAYEGGSSRWAVYVSAQKTLDMINDSFSEIFIHFSIKRIMNSAKKCCFCVLFYPTICSRYIYSLFYFLNSI